MPFTVTQLESSRAGVPTPGSAPNLRYPPLALCVLIPRLVIPPLWLDEEAKPQLPTRAPSQKFWG